jgi:hypothetical protein
MKRIVLIITLAVVFFAYPFDVKADSVLPIELHILSSETLSGTAGEFVTVDAEIANKGTNAVNNITTYLSLVNADTKMPVDLEDWSAERGLFIGSIDAGQTFPLTWKLHFVQSGNYTLSIVANIEDSNMPVISKLTWFEVIPKQNLNPGQVLPVALGEPIFLVFAFMALKYWRDRKSNRGK